MSAGESSTHPVFDALMGRMGMDMTSVVRQYKDATERGEKIIGAYCAYFPPEIALAVGAIPVGLCNTRPSFMSAAERHLPRNLCPLIKASYGFALEDQCPFFHFSDVVIGETTCDGKKKMFEYMNRLKPVHVMHLPYDRGLPHAVEAWTAELRRAIRFLEDRLGLSFDGDRLREAILQRNRLRALMRRLYRACEGDPPALSGHDVMKLTEISMFLRDTGRMTTELESIIASIEAAGDSRFRKGAPRILITGVPIGTGSDKLIEEVEKLGAPIVAQEMCSGQKVFLEDVDETGDPVEALARWSLAIPCSCMSPNPLRFARLEDMAGKYRADGVIDFTWIACHTYACESAQVGELAEKKLGIPFLRIESDYGDADREQIKTRAQAFVEMCSSPRR